MPNQDVNATNPNRRYRIYVIRLSNRVLHRRRFRNANPHYEDGRPAVYVGSTVQDVEVRFEQHKKGGMFANTYAHQFGKRLFSYAYEDLPSYATKEEAVAAERAHAEELRSRGWAVWQA